eukprot:2220935-Heterocapsa_arctica.AAC.1
MKSSRHPLLLGNILNIIARAQSMLSGFGSQAVYVAMPQCQHPIAASEAINCHLSTSSTAS